MKYKKGTFVVVPNLDSLRGKNTEYQVVFLWLCTYANDNGNCFPSRKKLAEDCGLTDRTIDKYLDMLIEDNLIEKTKRKKKGTNEYLTNLYQLLLPQRVANRKEQPSVSSDTTPSEPNIPITIPSINYNNLTNKETKVSAPFSLEEELVKLENSNWKPNKILALYLRFSKLKFQNSKQFNAEINKNKKGAISLEGYNSDQILATLQYCENNYKDFGYNLYTVVKRIPLIVNKKIN